MNKDASSKIGVNWGTITATGFVPNQWLLSGRAGDGFDGFDDFSGFDDNTTIGGVLDALAVEGMADHSGRA